ncbi:Hypothetical predicted protein [Olea europaea subsp. europaea]|uniref:Senescence regulator n=1 Tax=Olea europaea subsp. europaea TaxID=158383 RepID=A0A8S0TH00_OLEEU|nr:Hypothetical predicted protein [Olea europaea subsp. europaea]
MAEEFQESEVIFQENVEYRDREEYSNVPVDSISREFTRIIKGKRKKLKDKKNSVPVNIPENANRKSWFQYVDSDFFGEDIGDDGEMVPPHVIIGRRLAGKMLALSICTGINGKRLKGRNLIEVRNSILKMTGFLET